MKQYYNTNEVDNDIKKLMNQKSKLNPYRNTLDLKKYRDVDEKIYQLKNLRARM